MRENPLLLGFPIRECVVRRYSITSRTATHKIVQAIGSALLARDDMIRLLSLIATVETNMSISLEGVEPKNPPLVGEVIGVDLPAWRLGNDPAPGRALLFAGMLA